MQTLFRFSRKQGFFKLRSCKKYGGLRKQCNYASFNGMLSRNLISNEAWSVNWKILINSDVNYKILQLSWVPSSRFSQAQSRQMIWCCSLCPWRGLQPSGIQDTHSALMGTSLPISWLRAFGAATPAPKPKFRPRNRASPITVLMIPGLVQSPRQTQTEAQVTRWVLLWYVGIDIITAV